MGNILTIEQAAELLHLNPQVVRQYLRQGKLPGRKIGKHWRVIEEELTDFVRQGGQEGSGKLSAWNERAREWRTLSQEQKMKRLDEIVGKYADVPFSSEDLMREHREEVERDEQRLFPAARKAAPGTEAARREWLALSQEERERRVNAAYGMCAGGTRTLDDFLREKHEEIDEENRRAEERHRAWLERNKDNSQ